MLIFLYQSASITVCNIDKDRSCPMIEFQNVSKLYGDKEALSNLNLQIENGEIMGLIGHNGAGKSTTIKSLVSIISPSSGRILVDGQDL